MAKAYPREFRDDVVAVARKGQSSLIFLALFFAIPIGIGAAIVAAVPNSFESKSLEPQRVLWQARAKRLRSASYCARDDIIFDKQFSGVPAKFIKHVFPN